MAIHFDLWQLLYKFSKQCLEPNLFLIKFGLQRTYAYLSLESLAIQNAWRQTSQRWIALNSSTWHFLKAKIKNLALSVTSFADDFSILTWRSERINNRFPENRPVFHRCNQGTFCCLLHQAAGGTNWSNGKVSSPDNNSLLIALCLVLTVIGGRTGGLPV